MMQEITEHLEVSECIVLSTCNRTEMYVYSDSESKGCVFNLMEDVLLGEAGAQDEEDIGNYLLFYHVSGHASNGIAKGLMRSETIPCFSRI